MYNRKTHQKFSATGTPVYQKNETSIVKNGVFAKTAITTHKIQEEFSGFIAEIEKRLPAENKDNTLQFLRNILREQYPHINKIKANKELMQQITNSFKTNIKKDDPYSLTTFIKSLISLLTGAKLNALIPGLTLLLPQIAAAATNTLGLTIHQGQPDGGQNLCAGILLDCLQGYLTEEGKSWTPDMPQFERRVSGTNTQNNDASYWQLRQCVDVQKLGNSVISAFTPSNNTVDCSAQSAIWYGEQVSAQATNIPVDKCEIFKDQFNANVQNCMTTAGRWKYIGIIMGSTIGGLAVLVGIAFAIYCSCRACDENDCKPSCC